MCTFCSRELAGTRVWLTSVGGGEAAAEAAAVAAAGAGGAVRSTSRQRRTPSRRSVAREVSENSYS